MDQDQFPDLAQIKDMICVVIQKQGLRSYDSINIDLYHKLDKYSGIIVHGDNDATDPTRVELAKRSVANYMWNRSLSSSDRLMILGDGNGLLVNPMLHDFDHTKNCPSATK